jgi:site-specific DNA-adenine methylase
MEKEILKLKELYQTYVHLHDEYKRIEREAYRLESERKQVKEILDQTREKELSLINKIKEEHGVMLSADDLLEMIKGNG